MENSLTNGTEKQKLRAQIANHLHTLWLYTHYSVNTWELRRNNSPVFQFFSTNNYKENSKALHYWLVKWIHWWSVVFPYKFDNNAANVSVSSRHHAVSLIGSSNFIVAWYHIRVGDVEIAVCGLFILKKPWTDTFVSELRLSITNAHWRVKLH